MQDNQRICDSCNSLEFDIVDNNYVCRSCSTILTQLADQNLVSENVFYSDGHKSRKSEYSTAQKRASQIVLHNEEKLKQNQMCWKISEPFTIIFKEQVHALLNTGLPMSYKVLAYRCWMAYLRATGEAYVLPNEQLVHPYVCGWGPLYNAADGQESFRAKKPGRAKKIVTSHNTTANSSDTTINTKTQHTATTKDKGKKVGKTESAVTVDETFFNGDEHDDFDGNDSEKIMGVDSTQEDKKKTTQTKVTMAKSNTSNSFQNHGIWRGNLTDSARARHFLLEFNLAVCYLSVVLLAPTPSGEHEDQRPLITLTDIILLIRRGKIPYFNALTSCPEGKFKTRDIHLAKVFERVSAPTHEMMYRIISHLLNLISISEIPKFPLLSYCFRFMHQLCLPHSLRRYQARLVRSYMQDFDCETILANDQIRRADIKFSPFYGCRLGEIVLAPDVFAMANVVYLLYLIFGLDDNCEINMSAKTIKLAELVAHPCNLFVICNWLSTLDACMNIKTIENVNSFEDFPFCMETVDDFINVTCDCFPVGGKVNAETELEMASHARKRSSGITGSTLTTPGNQSMKSDSKTMSDCPPVFNRMLLNDSRVRSKKEFTMGDKAPRCKTIFDVIERDMAGFHDQSVEHIMEHELFVDKYLQVPTVTQNDDVCGDHLFAQEHALLSELKPYTVVRPRQLVGSLEQCSSSLKSLIAVCCKLLHCQEASLYRNVLKVQFLCYPEFFQANKNTLIPNKLLNAFLPM